MPGLNGAALMLLQDNGDGKAHDLHFGMIFLCVIAVCLVVQAVGFVVAGVFAAKLLARIDSITNDVQRRTGPILDKTDELMVELVPKLRALTENAEQISYTVRAKVDEIGDAVNEVNRTVREINGRTRTQIARVDGIVTDTLVATQEISRSVQHTIRTPVRQVAGIVAGLKAGLETLIERFPFGGGRSDSGQSGDDGGRP